MARRNYRVYCSLYGCLNSSITEPELTFFKLPTQPERLSQWLRLICREDLADKPSMHYRVCESHFKEEDKLPSPNRKVLKKNAFPSLNLPNLQRKIQEGIQTEEKETQVELIAVENLSQTGTDVAGTSAQTSTSLTNNTPRKRKLRSELLQCKQRLKIIESESNTHKSQESTFHELCDKFLTCELALLVKAQTRLKLHGKSNRDDQDYILFCLNLYFTSPLAYRLLQSALCLPCTTPLNKHSFPFTTEINERAMYILKIKVAQMTESEKNCSVMMDTMSLKTNLFYDIKEDKIIGFHEVEGWQSQEPAKNALVIMVRGIFDNWKQPIAYVLLSEFRNYDKINEWIDKVLEMLFDIGLNIRSFVSDQGTDIVKAARKRSISAEKPYFFVKDRKIYYIFDAPRLIKNVRNNLMQYDFHFGNSVAKFEHIESFYEKDVKKSCRLAHKLTNSHIKPTNFEKKKVRFAAQLLSRSVATGLFTYIDFNVIKESGRDTADFITKINDLFDALNSSTLRHSYEHKRAYQGEESQKAFFKELMIFFQGLKLKNPSNGCDCTSKVKFIEGFQITITSILLLFDDLKLEGYTFLFTRRLNQDALKKLFMQIRSKNGMATKPTCRKFASAFKNTYFSNITKPPKRSNCADDLEKFLVQTTREMGNIYAEPINTNEISSKTVERLDSDDQIMRSEYNQLDMPEKKSLFYICWFLLKRCAEKHKDCQILMSYIKPYQRNHNFSAESRYLRYRDYSKNTFQNYLIVPCDDFVEYVEKMEQTFRSFFKRQRINCKVSASIYIHIKDIHFSSPCPCFPKVYLMKLFIRMRIFYTLKFNNRAFRKSQKRRKYFSVANL